MNNYLLRNVDSAQTTPPGEEYAHVGGSLEIVVWADDFGGGEVTLEKQVPDGSNTWINLFYASDGEPVKISDNRVEWIRKLATGSKLRARFENVTGSPSNVNVWVGF